MRLFLKTCLDQVSCCCFFGELRSNTSAVQLARVHLTIDGGLSSVSGIDSSAVNLGSGKVKDIKIFGDTNLLVLWELDGKHPPHISLCTRPNKKLGTTTLLTIPYNPPTDTDTTAEDFQIEYSLLLDNSSPKPVVFTNEEVKERFEKHTIPTGGSFVPEKLEVRSGAFEMRRIVVLGKDGVHYKVLNFEKAGKGKGKGSDGDVEMVGDV